MKRYFYAKAPSPFILALDVTPGSPAALASAADFCKTYRFHHLEEIGSTEYHRLSKIIEGGQAHGTETN